MSRGARHRTEGPTYFPSNYCHKGTMWAWDPRLRVWSYPQSYGLWWPYPSTTYRSYFKECWDECHPGPPYRSGGPFFLRSMQLSVGRQYISSISHWDCSSTVIRKYEGDLVLLPNASINPLEVDSWLERASTFGAQAWRMFSPDKPTADLSQFWIELRDIRSQFSKSQAVFKTLKDAANSYLGYEFGWMPFLRDIEKLIKAINNLDAIVARMVKNNGKWQRRHGVVKELVDSTGSIAMGNLIQPILTGEFYPGAVTSSGAMSIDKVDQTWFEARMKYYLPYLENPSKLDCAKLLAKIVGLDFSKPLLYWKVFPYSWLIDWFGNMSHLIQGMESLLSTELTAKYAYVMDERVKTVELSQYQPLKCDESIDLKTTYTLRSKERASVNPMGFGPLTITLSPKQAAILAALGIQGNFTRI